MCCLLPLVEKELLFCVINGNIQYNDLAFVIALTKLSRLRNEDHEKVVVPRPHWCNISVLTAGKQYVSPAIVIDFLLMDQELGGTT